MSEIADRYRKIAGRFTERADEVPADGWDKPAPCEGWVARDVVRHMVEWMPGFFSGTLDLASPGTPSVDEDPAAAWRALTDAIQAALDDPAVAAIECETQAGRHRVDDAIAMFFMGDVLVHTWDLARATGQDERLDPDFCAQMLAGMEPIAEMIYSSGQYGPPVPVPADADAQTRLLGFIGRDPDWRPTAP